MYESGKTFRECALAFGVSRMTISRCLVAAGAKIRRKPPANFKAIVTHAKEIVKMYRSGKTLEECRELFGVSTKATRTLLRKAGVKTRPPGRPVMTGAQRKDYERCTRQIARMYLAGHTVAECGRAFDLSGFVVWSRLKKAGIPRRRVRPPGRPWLPRALQMYQDGQSLVQIGKAVGRTKQAVWQAMRKAGCPKCRKSKH